MWKWGFKEWAVLCPYFSTSLSSIGFPHFDYQFHNGSIAISYELRKLVIHKDRHGFPTVLFLHHDCVKGRSSVVEIVEISSYVLFSSPKLPLHLAKAVKRTVSLIYQTFFQLPQVHTFAHIESSLSTCVSFISYIVQCHPPFVTLPRDAIVWNSTNMLYSLPSFHLRNCVTFMLHCTDMTYHISGMNVRSFLQQQLHCLCVICCSWKMQWCLPILSGNISKRRKTYLRISSHPGVPKLTHFE